MVTTARPIPISDHTLIDICHSGHHQVRTLAADLLTTVPDDGRFLQSLAQRAEKPGACRQDVLPWLVYQAVRGSESAKDAIPLTTIWALYLAAAHLMDKAQDTGCLTDINSSIMALGAANLALSELIIAPVGLRDILATLGQVTLLGCRAQTTELLHSRVWSREDYFRYIAGKSAAIIATGVWLGGRMATEDEATLKLLKSFGLALGMAMQIGDDCLDLAEDLAQGVFTLPVIEGLSMVNHPRHPALHALTSKPTLSAQDISTTMTILDEMGAVDVCRRLMHAYQAQAEAVFEMIPNLAAYFADYVSPKV